MPTQRKLASIQSPHAEHGFLGNGHTARAVIGGSDFAHTDPFIILMDDMLDKQDNEPAGGPHPHAGFETVTLLLEGEMGDARHTMKTGDMQLMTAGSGIVHTETIDTTMKMRLLQLWLGLPKKDRWAAPRLQDIAREHAPLATGDGVEIRVYSGTFAGVSSPVRNYTPLVIADIQLQPNATTTQQLPAAYNAFLYVIDGVMQIGEDSKTLSENQIGWLDKFTSDTHSELALTAGTAGGRAILYAGLPTNVPIISHGPFIGDTQEDIIRLYREYRGGMMGHINDVVEERKVRW